MNKIKSWFFFGLLVCHMVCHDWPTWHTVSFDFFSSNWESTEGLKPKVLQTTGTNAKQKKAQRSMPKLCESAGLNIHLNHLEMIHLKTQNITNFNILNT